jgi:hypothetical protein
MLNNLYIENKFFVYAILLHIVFFLLISFFTIDSPVTLKDFKSESINVTTYDKMPFENKTIEKQKIDEKLANTDTLSLIEKEVLSYSVDGFDVVLDDKGLLEMRDLNNSFDKDFNEIQKSSNLNNESIFKHSQDIETLSRVYGYIKRQSENIELMANMTSDKEELLRSKSMLLSYEKYQKTLFYKIINNWKHPELTGDDWSCKVEVIQSSTGNVMKINFMECVDDERFRRAVKITVFKSSPLPLPSDDSIFNEKIYFTFKAN